MNEFKKTAQLIRNHVGMTKLALQMPSSLQALLSGARNVPQQAANPGMSNATKALLAALGVGGAAAGGFALGNKGGLLEGARNMRLKMNEQAGNVSAMEDIQGLSGAADLIKNTLAGTGRDAGFFARGMADKLKAAIGELRAASDRMTANDTPELGSEHWTPLGA